MFYLYLKSSRSLKDSDSQASQELSLEYTKLNGHSISPSSIISLVEISIDASPPCPHSIAGSPSGNPAILRRRLDLLCYIFCVTVTVRLYSFVQAKHNIERLSWDV